MARGFPLWRKSYTSRCLISFTDAVNAPSGPFDAATCVLVLGLIADDGSKLSTLEQVRPRLKPGAPFVLVDLCIDLSAPDAARRLDRYGRYALRSGVAADTVARARTAIGDTTTMVPDWRVVELLAQAGFGDIDLFYAGMAWRGWVAYP